MIYSPKAKQDYVLQTLEGEYRGFGASELLDVKGSWNLFYLSEPLADVSDRWQDSETVPEFAESIWPCHLTCELFPHVAEALTKLQPVEFILYLKTLNYRDMPMYELLGETWLEIMEARARPPKGVVAREGNVLMVNFMGDVLSLPDRLSSCIIMPMSYKRH
jgi:hypothetical protein